LHAAGTEQQQGRQKQSGRGDQSEFAHARKLAGHPQVGQ